MHRLCTFRPGRTYRTVRAHVGQRLSTKIPEPTWSLASLELDQPHEPITRSQLETLARRALLYVKDDAHALQLQQDVGNMMFLLSQIQRTQVVTEQRETCSSTAKPQPDAGAVYDVPRRGISRAPLRESSEPLDKEEMQKVWDSLLKPKTTRVGAHNYFVIQTGEKL
jgi:hypothetical protein